MGTMLDVLGIGFGPANIALAVSLEELYPRMTSEFLEAQSTATWQPGMLLDGSDIQNHPLRDLVTPRNPQSRYTFVNYLHQNNRLFEFLNLGVTYPLRKEYSRYIEWVAQHFGNRVTYGMTVVELRSTRLPASKGPHYEVVTEDGTLRLCRALVVAPGRTALIPREFESILGERVFHLTEYLSRIQSIASKRNFNRILVVGASQSAVEIVIDLSSRLPEIEIVNVMRSFGYQLKDTSPFSERVYFPEFVDYFYRSKLHSRQTLTDELRRTNYSSADADVINQLYRRIYEQKLDGKQQIFILSNYDIIAAQIEDEKVVLTMREKHRGTIATERVDAVVLATGFRNLGPGDNEEKCPRLLQSLCHHFKLNNDGTLCVNYDYSLETTGDVAPIYLNGLCESSHGLGDAGSFSLLALRSATIVKSLAKRLSEEAKSPLVIGSMALKSGT